MRSVYDYDLTKFPEVVYLILIFLVSRAPFINMGFSAFTSPTDLDVLAVVNSAHLLRYEHVYAVSRFPGSPFYEIINSLLIGGGWIATNAATAIVSLISIILFGKILKILEIKYKALLLVTFAFTPVIWINSTITMDYMWGLMFILLAFYLMFIEKYYFAGIALSFAIGSRITSLVIIIPLLYWMLHRKCNVKTISAFLGITTIASLAIFSPLIYKYGFEFLKYSPREITFNEVFNGITTQLLSVPAIILLLLAFVIARDIPKNDFSYNLSLSVLLVYALLFIYHPAKPAYLIPAVPWGLVALSKSFSRIAVISLCFLIVLNGIISVEIQNDEKLIGFDQGSVLKNYDDRKQTGIAKSEDYLESLSKLLSDEKNTQGRDVALP